MMTVTQVFCWLWIVVAGGWGMPSAAPVTIGDGSPLVVKLAPLQWAVQDPIAEGTETNSQNVTGPASNATMESLTGELPRDPSRPVIRECIYGHKVGLALTYDVIQPPQSNGAGVIFVVSGGWNSRYSPPEQFRRMALLGKLYDAGFVVIMMRHGSAPLFKVPEAVEDIRRGVRHVRQHAEEYGFSPDRLGICGASAGGHLSLMMGTTGDQQKDQNQERNLGRPDTEGARVAAVAAYFPPTDLRGMVGPSDRFPALDFNPSLAESVSPIAQVTAGDAPTLLVHGTRDRLVPKQHSEKIAEQFQAVGVPFQLLILEGAGHGFVGQQAQQAEQAVVEWFEKYLLER